MRKILFILFALFSVTSYSQDYYIVNDDTLGIIITIDQAQKIDNDYELLELYQGLDMSDTVYIKIIDEQEKEITTLKLSNEKLKEVSRDKTVVIDKLNSKIEIYEENQTLCKEKLDNKDEIIESKDKIIRKLKIQKFIGGIGGGVIIATLVAIILFVG
jgi:hypothetical protein